MKRKVALIGPSSLMVSLPSKWVKQWNIKKGDEVEVQEKEGVLMIGTPLKEEERSIVLDMKDFELGVNRVIGALYKQGYDQVTLHISSPKQLETIYQVLKKTCIGYEIIEQTKGKVVMKQISKLEPNEFDHMLKRLFLFLLCSAEECVDAMDAKKVAAVNTIITRDDSINRYADFCRRVLNVQQMKKANAVYHVIEQMERIGDEYKDMCKYVMQQKMILDEKLIPKVKVAKEVLEQFYHLFYGFSFEKLEFFYKKYNNDARDMDDLLKQIKNPEQIRVLFHLRSIVKLVFDAMGNVIIAKGEQSI